jgi:hypothetical protein
MNWLATPVRLLDEFTNELSFITRGEPKRDHRNQDFVFCYVYIRCHSDTFAEPLWCKRVLIAGNSSFLPACLLLRNPMFTNRCPTMDAHFDFTIPVFSRHITILNEKCIYKFWSSSVWIFLSSTYYYISVRPKYLGQWKEEENKIKIKRSGVKNRVGVDGQNKNMLYKCKFLTF